MLPLCQWKIYAWYFERRNYTIVSCSDQILNGITCPFLGNKDFKWILNMVVSRTRVMVRMWLGECVQGRVCMDVNMGGHFPVIVRNPSWQFRHNCEVLIGCFSHIEIGEQLFWTIISVLLWRKLQGVAVCQCKETTVRCARPHLWD